LNSQPIVSALPRISIITSTYNCAESLKKTAKSIRQQSYKNIQWIVADGASTDGTLEVIKSNMDIITNWFSETDSGIYDAWNKASNFIDGDWVLFLGAGDLISHNSSLIEFWQSTPNNPQKYSLIYGNVEIIKPDGSLRYVCKKKNLNFWEFGRPALPSHQGVFHARRLFSASKPFDIAYKIAADSKFMLQALKLGATFYKDITVTKMPDDGISNNANNLFIARKEIKKLLDELKIQVPLIIEIQADVGRLLFFIAHLLFSNNLRYKLQKIIDRMRPHS
jgi:glycosyltransferase involved in cell wall biosynthesis